MISNWIKTLLINVADKKLGPTITARWLFLFTQLIHDGYQFVTGGDRNLDLFPVPNKKYNNIINIQTWIEYVCDFSYMLITKKLEISYDSKLPENDKIFNEWKARAENYMNIRDQDGWLNAGTLSGTIPNQGKYIETTSSGLPTGLDTVSWTPLSISGSHKNYLTPEWGSLIGVISTDEFTQLTNCANKYLPKSVSDWDAETKSVLEITKNLTDKDKMSVEFWAGGPGSVTPPGFWFVFAYCICASKNLSIHDEIKIYTLLGLGVFQASIVAWKLKRDNLQARPIQRIRYLYNDEKDWLPYQETNFVTPPFPDFVSGHSTFSSVCAKILYKFLKTNSIDLEGTTFDSSILKLLNPDLFSQLSNSQSTLCQINILPKSSSISSAPLSGCRLSWATLDDMAEDAGRSRIYGGIHVESSNQAGLSLGRELADILCDKYSDVLNFIYGQNVKINGFKIYKNSTRI